MSEILSLPRVDKIDPEEGMQVSTVAIDYAARFYGLDWSEAYVEEVRRDFDGGLFAVWPRGLITINKIGPKHMTQQERVFLRRKFRDWYRGLLPRHRLYKHIKGGYE